MTININTLEPDILSEISCSSSIALQALRAAARRFTRETGIWTETDTIVTQENTATYTINVTGAQVVHVERITLDGTALRASQYTVSVDGIVTLNTIPDAGLDLVAHVSVVPGRTLALYPDWLISQWGDALVAGAKADLYARPQPWSDRIMAQHHNDMFQREVGAAKALRAQQRQPGGLIAAGVRTVTANPEVW